MNSHYKNVSEATNEIAVLLSENKPIEVINYKMLVKYGFTDKMVSKIIKTLEDLKSISDKDKGGL